MNHFPKDFIWGVASSAYQLEGSFDKDGRGLSVWDDFCQVPGAVFDGNTGDKACEHYIHYPEDVKLMKDLGVKAYRFSISWSRILPSGIGSINEKGLAFYDKLIDKLLEANITPWITLFHWDFPLELYFKGGWLNRDSIYWFQEYTEIVVKRFSDRVKNWITLNEPQCYIGLGHDLGVHAPGLNLSKKEVLRAIHHTLLAHGIAVKTIRENAIQKPIIGWSPVGWVSYPANDNAQSIEAARKVMFDVPIDDPKWTFNNSWYSDPVILGKYPEKAFQMLEKDMPFLKPDDFKILCQPLDFYGVNIYHGASIAVPVAPNSELLVNKRIPGYPQTQMGWTVDPEAIYWGTRFLHERYKLPIYVTENGVASMDWIHADGNIHDSTRIDYLARHLFEVRRAIEDGVDIRGYFHWSIMDNFEWELGYSRRFGLVYIDYQNMKRRPKDSFYWFQKVIESEGRNISIPRPISSL